MFIYKYIIEEKPNHIENGGYYPSPSGEMIGFSFCDSATAISLEDGIAHALENISIPDDPLAGLGRVSFSEKKKLVIQFFEWHGYNLGSIDWEKAFSDARAVILKPIRIERNKRLSETDWTQLQDSPLSSSEKAAYVTYRQALRDLPSDQNTIENYDDVVWPEL